MAIITLISSGITNSISSSVRLASVVDEIRNEIKNVYSDISEAHFHSARQAFRAATSSSNPSDEIRNAIAHLRDSYNILEMLLNKKVTTGFLFWTSEENLLRWNSQRIPVYLAKSQLAILIAISYSMLSEYSNARDWKRDVLHCFDQYVTDSITYYDGYCDYSDGSKNSEAMKKLKAMNLGYTQDKYSPISLGGEEVYQVEIKLTSKGIDYIKNSQTEQRQDIIYFLSKMGI